MLENVGIRKEKNQKPLSCRAISLSPSYNPILVPAPADCRNFFTLANSLNFWLILHTSALTFSVYTRRPKFSCASFWTKYCLLITASPWLKCRLLLKTSKNHTIANLTLTPLQYLKLVWIFHIKICQLNFCPKITLIDEFLLSRMVPNQTWVTARIALIEDLLYLPNFKIYTLGKIMMSLTETAC